MPSKNSGTAASTNQKAYFFSFRCNPGVTNRHAW